ncbi:MAG: SPASM domain-containing protein [Bacteroidota bacterium]
MYQLLPSFARTVSTYRIQNFYRVWRSFQRAKSGRGVQQQGLPFSLSVEPTTTCNLKCPHCPSGLRQFTRPTGAMDDALFGNILNELATSLGYLLFYFQGEPYLNTKFLEWANEAHQRRIFTATSTNAHYLNPELAEKTVRSRLSKLIVSVDGVDQESYAKYRVGGKLEKVQKGVQNLIETRKKLKSRTPFVQLQFIVFRHNEDQVEAVKQLGKSWGVDEVSIKTAQIYDYQNGDAFIPQNEKLSRYRKTSKGKYVIKNQLLDHCWRMWHSAVVTWDGRVVPCCFDKDASHQMGDLREKSFKEIWFGERYQQFREQLFRNRSEIDICKNCTEGTQVWV